jgi:3-phosphoshikimate 1-carboxyvinyltransferase
VIVTDTPDGLLVRGVGPDGLRAPQDFIDCGNSGTTMRLLAGLTAGQRFQTVLAGDESLRRRPMRRVAEPLRRMGATISGQSGGDAADIYPPLTISGGQLHGIEFASPVASAQVKSALILAALYADGPTQITESARSRDHTERMLTHMGAPIAAERGGPITVDPRGWDRGLTAEAFFVPGDPSSSAFLVAAAVLAPVDRLAVTDVCVNETRTGFLDVLRAMGATVSREIKPASGGEPTADLVVTSGAADGLSGTVVAGEMTVRAIDELPILAVVAARGYGTTEFRDAAELRVKESDRIATTCAMLRALGVEVTEWQDGFEVDGTGGRPFTAGRIEAHGDHRIAMAGAIAALAADGPVRIDDVDNVATSFPEFVPILRELGADVAEVV